ncbi:thiol reductant ABC exporter subunit CydD [Stomatohabitans albus]|uniref:thiol reductant ABC exporter subunit CydD n=1 Tax=Stomatohabitans albus TaxID=3110766 RepID=UPI00300CC712
MAKPIDPRLFKRAGNVRTLVISLGMIAGVRSLLWVLIAFTISLLVVGARDHTPLATWAAVGLGVGLVIRPCLAYIAEQLSRRQATITKHELRMQALAHSGAVTDQSSGQITAMLTSGADALDEWFGRFLPSALEGVVMPGIVIAAIAITDWVSLLILIVTVPLLGVFGWLIGVETRDQANKQYVAMTRLSGHFLDLLYGLETLRLFGVARQQDNLVRHAADGLRTETMATLRIAFLSALALELVAMIGTALIAVTIGIRLSYGLMELMPGLAVLIMAPEAYLPIRRVGATFHASTEGAAAGAALLDAIEHSPSVSPSPTTQSRAITWELDHVTVIRQDRLNVADACLTVSRGELVALAGESGSGKSTLLGVLAGLVPIDSGTIRVDGQPTELQPATPGIVWMPQSPVVLATTLRDNLTFGKPIDEERIVSVLHACGAQALIPRLDEFVGQGGSRLSGGEARRVGLARALLAEPVLLLADEPTTEVDDGTASIIRGSLNDLTANGTAVIVATHDQVIIDAADHVVALAPIGHSQGEGIR